MEDNQAQNFENFAHRFQLAEQLQKGDRGVIFIGNTRVGKTTLSCASAGLKIDIKHDSMYQLTFLHPVDKSYSELVRDSNQSVTTTPNFFRNNQLAIIDMPGYADSSRFRQFINYHYIKTMIKNLKQIRFLVVITLSNSAGKYLMEPFEKRMLQSFVDAFPDCKDCTSLIINRVETRDKIKQNELQKEAEAVKGAFRNIIQQSPKIKSYFQTLSGDRIHIIFRPSYKANQNNTDWNEAYPQINQTMRNICLSTDAKYMNIQNLKTKIQIFKQGDNTQNLNFIKLLQQILKKEQQAVINVKECFQSIIVLLMQGLVLNDMNEQLYKLEQTLKEFQDKDTTKEYLKKNSQINIENYNTFYSLTQSKIIKLCISLNFNISFKEDSTQTDILGNIESIFGQLSWITVSLFSNNKLKQRMKYLHVYMVRRLRQSFFIYKALIDQQLLPTEKLINLVESIGLQSSNLKNFEKYISIFRESLKKIADSILQINLKYRFGNAFSQGIKNELVETLNSMKILYGERIIIEETNLIKKYLLKVEQKIKEVQLYSLLVTVPNNPLNIKNNVEKLLAIYPTVQNREQKNIIAFKLAGNLAKTQRKQAIPLYFHLEIYQQVLKLTDQLLQSTRNQTQKNEIALKWYTALADEFKVKNILYYYERCLQKVKLYLLEDYDKINEIKKQQKQGFAAISKSIKNSSLEQQKKREEQTFRKIDQEIMFLRILHKLQPQTTKKNLKVIGVNFRH